MSTSKVLTPPQSHIKDKSAVKGWGPPPHKYAGDNTWCAGADEPYILLHREELMWLYGGGASFVYPDKWEKFVEPIPKVERGDLLSAYHRR